MHKHGCTTTAIRGIIGTVILGSAGSLLAVVFGYLPAVDAALRACANSLLKFWEFLIASTSLPNWIILSWLAVSVWAASVFIRQMIHGRKKVEASTLTVSEGKPTQEIQPQEPKLVYKRDKIFGLWWYWTRSLVDNRLKIKKCCCPQCHLELDIEQKYDYQSQQAKTAYHCEEHGQVAELVGRPQEIEHQVIKRVQKNYDTGEWKAIAKEQQENPI